MSWKAAGGGVLGSCWCMFFLTILVGFYLLFACFVIPMGCWFGGCTNLGTLEKTVGPEIPQMSVVGEFEDGDSWKYYRVDLKTYANNMVLYSINTTANICLGYSSIGKPRQCNLPTQDENELLICPQQIGAVIGVKNLDGNNNKDYSFTLVIGNPYNSMDGLACGFLYMIILGTILLACIFWIIPLICCTTIFAYPVLSKRLSHQNQFKYEIALDESVPTKII